MFDLILTSNWRTGNNAPFGREAFQTNLILPEPAGLLRKDLPACSVVRPTLTETAGAVAAVNGLTADTLFDGQSRQFFKSLREQATAADAARRQVG